MAFWKRLEKVILIIFFLITAYCCWISHYLTIELYTINENITDSIRIVQLSDLHNQEFGKDNDKLIKLVKEESPDLIVMTGDMINNDVEDLSIIVNLISGLSEVAQVFYGYGNHEVVWERNFRADLEEPLSAAGAIVLNNNYVDIKINNQDIRIGGYMGYYRCPGMLTSDEEQKKKELAFADLFEDTDKFKLLLNHIPTQWVDWDYINEYPVDLVFCGHYHGGMLRIPLIDRGVFAPYVGWFPPYTKGIYRGTEASCVLSAGLGSEHMIPRFNNPPEIVVVDLVPEVK